MNKHENQVPFTYISEMGVAVTAMCNDGNGQRLSLKATNPPINFCLCFMNGED
ncbi:MAG: hypothetical protein IPO03_02530 [Bacteroidetes bacterium]|nr:hypothetical protein [Bacteroidota bacterium]